MGIESIGKFDAANTYQAKTLQNQQQVATPELFSNVAQVSDIDCGLKIEKTQNATGSQEVDKVKDDPILPPNVKNYIEKNKAQIAAYKPIKLKDGSEVYLLLKMKSHKLATRNDARKTPYDLYEVDQIEIMTSDLKRYIPIKKDNKKDDQGYWSVYGMNAEGNEIPFKMSWDDMLLMTGFARENIWGMNMTFPNDNLAPTLTSIEKDSKGRVIKKTRLNPPVVQMVPIKGLNGMEKTTNRYFYPYIFLGADAHEQQHIDTLKKYLLPTLRN